MAFTQTSDDIIKAALRLVNETDANTAPDVAVLERARDALNTLINSLQEDGTLDYQVVLTEQTLTASSSVTGTDGNYYRCIKAHTSATANKPITGASWPTYWILDGSQAGGTWVTSTAYTTIGEFSPASGTLDVLDMYVKYNGSDDQVRLITQEDYDAISEKYVESTTPDTA